MFDRQAKSRPPRRPQPSTTKTAQQYFAAALFCPVGLLAACGPALDPPPLVIHECPADDSPTELARFDYDPEVDFEPFDLGHAATVRLGLGGYDAEHYVVDNCGGTPLRLENAFGYRPGAARVGGDIVLCSGGLEGLQGLRELLEDGSGGDDLGLGLGCLDRGNSFGSRTGMSAHGFVWTETGVTQYLPDGEVRSLTLFGEFTRVNDTWLVHTDEGEVGMLGSDGADPVVLDLPEAIIDVASPPDSSPWVVLLPDSQGQDYARPYVLDTTDGSWFTAGLGWAGLDANRVAVRDGLAVTRFPVNPAIEFTRAQWDASLRTDLNVDAGFTVVNEEHVLTADDRDVRLLRIPLDFPGENEAAYEVLWKYPVPSGESLAGSYPGMLWQDLVLLRFQGETWAFPTDGSEPYPFLPGNLDDSYIYFGSEFITAMIDTNSLDDTAQIIRRAVGGELEVVADSILSVQTRPWTPELGRILYAVRDGEHVSIRQHRLTD